MPLCPDLGLGYPFPPNLELGYPLPPRPGTRVHPPPPAELGTGQVPPPPPPNRKSVNGTAWAYGMPFAVTQEDFLLSHIFAVYIYEYGSNI